MFDVDFDLLIFQEKTLDLRSMFYNSLFDELIREHIVVHHQCHKLFWITSDREEV